MSNDYSNQDPNAFLMGGGVPSASFLKIGAGVTGTICEPPVLKQQRDMTTDEPKVWDDGSPMLQLVVTLQTDDRSDEIEDDDGRRRIYVKSNMKKAIADAVRKAGAKALDVGGKLTVTYSADGEASRRGFNPPKLYTASYTPPTANFLSDDRDEEPQKTSAVVNAVDRKESPTTGRVAFIVQTNQGEFGTTDSGIGTQLSKMQGAVVELTWEPTSKGGKRIIKWRMVADKVLADTSGGAIDEDDIPF